MAPENSILIPAMSSMALRSQTADRREGVKGLPFSNAGVTGLKFTRFLCDVARQSQINFLKSELRQSTPFRNATAANEGESADFARFHHKIGCSGKILWVIGKVASSSNLRSNIYYMVKISETLSGEPWDNLSERFTLKKKRRGVHLLPS